MILKLSNSEIKALQDELDYLQESLTYASSSIVNRLVNIGYDKVIELNNLAPQSGLSKSTVTKESPVENGGWYVGSVSLEGEHAVYDEFGTGEFGLSLPHPLKGNFDLNPYNSGPFVSTHFNKYGRHYWFIPKGKYDSGVTDYVKPSGYTEGIPAGKQMYNTTDYIRKTQQGIINEELNGATKTLR